jgi:hypothetical protein
LDEDDDVELRLFDEFFSLLSIFFILDIIVLWSSLDVRHTAIVPSLLQEPDTTILQFLYTVISCYSLFFFQIKYLVKIKIEYFELST